VERKGLVGTVGRLLVDGRAYCVQELGALVIAHDRLNQFIYGLKWSRVQLKPGTSLEAFKVMTGAKMYLTFEETFERVAMEFLTAERPPQRHDIWDALEAKLKNAAVVYTDQLNSVLREFVPD
jgi:hypothetical protein